MIDHVLGRPSVKFRKTQVFAVVAFWSFYLWKGDRHGPPIIRRLSKSLSRTFTTWQTVVLTLIYLYVTRNFGKVVGLECPEPLANLYTRSYFRATWVTTALDAGFWTAMYIRPKWLKDLCSVVFTVYYLICAEQADEKVRKVRGALTLQHLRVSWNKPLTPYLWGLTNVLRPRVTKYKFPPRELRIPRPAQSSYNEPVHAWLYFDGPLAELRNHDKIILDVPGGGFVSMSPRCHEDKLIGWSGRTGLPVLAIDYGKAPEHPYPYALNECYDVYHTLVQTRGRCIGMSGQFAPKIVVAGDSAGGNLAVGMVLMILQSGSSDTRRFMGETAVPPPEGVVLTYPALDMNIGSWMTDEQMALIKDRKSRKENQSIVRRKSDDYRNLTSQDHLHNSDSEGEDEGQSSAERMRLKSKPNLSREPNTAAAHTVNAAAVKTSDTKPTILKTRLAMSSIISYFNDRILTPEMLRAMVILYVGPHSRPDLSTDFLLSPILAPDALLARFPKTYFLTGERDPLVDDTVIFAGRIRQAKKTQFESRKDLGLISSKEQFDETDWVNVALVPGISHGFLQFVSVYPEGWRHIMRCARYMTDIFREADQRAFRAAAEEHARLTNSAPRNLKIDIRAPYPDDTAPSAPPTGTLVAGKRHFFRGDDDDDDDDDDDEEEDDDEDAIDEGDGKPVAATSSTDGPSARRRHHRRMRTGSSGDEDRPLEMTTIRSPVLRQGSGSKKPWEDGFEASPSSPSGKRSSNGKNKNAEDTSSPARSASLIPAATGKAPRDNPDKKPSRTRGKTVVGLDDEGRLRDQRSKSVVNLTSGDDILGRRMDGFAGGLMGRLVDGGEQPR